MAAPELFSKANEQFVDENYEEAVKLYSEAISADDSQSEYYSNRANALLKLNNFGDAANDAMKALEINPQNSKALLRKGLALFHQKKFTEAKEAFQCGKENSKDNNFDTWLKKCEDELKKAEQVPEKVDAAKTIPMPTGPNTRYDWYQTEKAVVITVMLKGVKKEDVDIDIQEKSLSACVRLGGGSDYTLELDLAHAIVAPRSAWKVLSTKIEIKLMKFEGIRWNKLERDPEAEESAKQYMAGTDADAGAAAQSYPSSAHYTRDWDKVVADIKKEEKDEKLEGDAALNQLFQQIYSDGNEETRKAMNKSFVESGGTVLSTNWGEIAEKNTDVKPPDGMEYKQWQQ